MSEIIKQSGWKSLLVIATISSFGSVSLLIAQKSLSLDSNGSQKLLDEQQIGGEFTDGTYVSKYPITCESFAALVDNHLVEWQSNQETYLIFIARLGKEETASNLSRARLKDVKDYLKRDPTIKYVAAQGSRVEGLGRIEIYVGGKLRTVIPIRKNHKHACSGKVNPFLR